MESESAARRARRAADVHPVGATSGSLATCGGSESSRVLFGPRLASPQGSTRTDGFARYCKWVAISLAAVGWAGCPADSEESRPGRAQLYFPTGLAVSPDEKFLFVANANSNLLYDSGHIQAFDLNVVDRYVDQWLTSGQGDSEGDCEVDLEHRETAICSDLSVAVAAAARIGNFAGQMRLQSLDDGSVRLFVPVRGEPSLTWLDFDPSSNAFDCGGSGDFPRCDDHHRLTHLFDDPTGTPLVSEPFGIHVASGDHAVAVSHLSTGAITLADAPPNRDRAPVLTDLRTGFFSPNPSTGVNGAVAVAGRRPNSLHDLLYVGSRGEARIQMFHIARPNGELPRFVTSDFFFLAGIEPADESRDLVFGSGGDRLYVVNRDPPVIDCSGHFRWRLRTPVESGGRCDGAVPSRRDRRGGGRWGRRPSIRLVF